MLEAAVLRSALSVFSSMFGGLGVFFVYMSFLKPALGVYAVVFLTFALGILHTAGPKKNFDWRLETGERAYAAGFRRLGIGALLGLAD